MPAAVTATVAHINHNGINGNYNGNGNGTGSSNQGDNQGPQLVCMYKDFTDNEPNPFNESGGVISLTQWCEKKELVFEIYDYPEESKVKFTASPFSNRALSWWNGHVKALKLPVMN